MKQPTLVRSFLHAVNGVIFVIRTQRNARIHVGMAVVVMVVGVWLGLERHDWAILAITIGAVLVGETINTAVEALVDLLSPQFHEQAKVAKDVSAGAVLLLSIAAIIVGLLVLGPPLWQRCFP